MLHIRLRSGIGAREHFFSLRTLWQRRRLTGAVKPRTAPFLLALRLPSRNLISRYCRPGRDLLHHLDRDSARQRSFGGKGDLSARPRGAAEIDHPIIAPTSPSKPPRPSVHQVAVPVVAGCWAFRASQPGPLANVLELIILWRKRLTQSPLPGILSSKVIRPPMVSSSSAQAPHAFALCLRSRNPQGYSHSLLLRRAHPSAARKSSTCFHRQSIMSAKLTCSTSFFSKARRSPHTLPFITENFGQGASHAPFEPNTSSRLISTITIF